MTKEKCVPGFVLFLCIVFLSFVFISIGTTEIANHKQDTTKCEEKGFDSASHEEAREGYVVCCNKQFENNIRIEDRCIAIPKTG